MGIINFELDETMHRAFKIKCINRGVHMEDISKELVESWVNGTISTKGEFSELEEGEQ